MQCVSPHICIGAHLYVLVSFWIVLHLLSHLNPEPKVTTELVLGTPSLHLPHGGVLPCVSTGLESQTLAVTHRVPTHLITYQKGLEKQEQTKPKFSK